METAEELTAFLERATQADIWGRLLDRGAAWALMRTEGQLPPDAPTFAESIEEDLAEHGFALLRAALALREWDDTSALASKGFEQAARSFESLVRNGDPMSPSRGFRRMLAAASYHLASFSAVAYSLFKEQSADRNNNPAEIAIECLILRDMNRLRRHVRGWLNSGIASDEAMAQAIARGDIDADAAVAVILNSAICRALAYFDFALQTGESELLGTARELLDTATDLAVNASNVPLWWTCRICRALLEDLWSHSLHVLLPIEGPRGSERRYPRLRRLFISSLYARRIAEVELWPSQREAAKRAADLSDDLVVALPTSAGKTRIAEIAALMTLATGKRVLLVTPLRALSAQTERSFRKTFAPMGFSVSSLYGASGISSGDEDALSSRDIVISTPEKLDFALRSDATLINDVGLIVLDEGHMIGPTEREIRYEALVQRLLRRRDAGRRRIVCLSAILPVGDELHDMTAWIRGDQPGDAVRSDWRPTRQRFGTLHWANGAARLNYDLDRNGPYVSRFVTEMAPRGRDQSSFPRKVADLSIQAAWEFANQGKRTLIFSTQANWVESFGRQSVNFVEKGYLPNLLDNSEAIQRAMEVGREWLGAAHPAVAALNVGVAVHHGRLPSPFLRELETLLSEGVLKVIVASPTLSQGLNLCAAVLLVPYLVRAGTVVSGEEFANVAGRAGRAFVDTEGLIVHVVFDKHAQRLRDWKGLVDSIKARSLKSGLIQVVAEILSRLAREGVLEREDAIEYLANSREAWMSQTERGGQIDDANAGSDVGDEAKESIDEEPLSQLVERLDATVFGLVEALDAQSADLPRLLDEALTGSLWARQMSRESEEEKSLHKTIIEARARLIWRFTTPSSRKGHFAMGVGLEAGLSLDAMASELDSLVDLADIGATFSGALDLLSESLIDLAERLLVIRPFVPDKRNTLPSNWQQLLKQWISGATVEEIGPDNMRVVEDAFMYRLVWALEAIRTRRASLGWKPTSAYGGGAAALETGVPELRMAMLIRAGLPSRQAAMAVVNACNPDYKTPRDMRRWLASEEVDALSRQEGWPTVETAALWRRFRENSFSDNVEHWGRGKWTRAIEIQPNQERPPSGWYRIESDEAGMETWLETPDFRRVARFRKAITDDPSSLWVARIDPGKALVSAARLGRGKAVWPRSDA